MKKALLQMGFIHGSVFVCFFTKMSERSILWDEVVHSFFLESGLVLFLFFVCNVALKERKSA